MFTKKATESTLMEENKAPPGPDAIEILMTWTPTPWTKVMMNLKHL